ncbi:thioredoxin domain-containing protein [Caulobacter endophyticus]|uniref:TlpA family protein disulfide reductase n=1 Tax=Caulobacter endophyticus TaxID=2172652 RepID=UPI0018EE898B|nr:TlpA family protein disulfide reductase [Caulobacter endophyticus]
MTQLSTPPPLKTVRWFNTDGPLFPPVLAGRVVAVYAFQMLCPGCVANALPQAQRLREAFAESDLAVIGLHTVFEHHEANTPAALEAFLHEYRIRFPVGVDAPDPDGGPIPQTMAAYALQGTPSLLLFDRQGRLVHQLFGHPPDLTLGAAVQALLQSEKAGSPGARAEAGDGCADGVCVAPVG